MLLLEQMSVLERSLNRRGHYHGRQNCDVLEHDRQSVEPCLRVQNSCCRILALCRLDETEVSIRSYICYKLPCALDGLSRRCRRNYVRPRRRRSQKAYGMALSQSRRVVYQNFP